MKLFENKSLIMFLKLKAKTGLCVEKRGDELTIFFKKVAQDNIDSILKLTVKKEQKSFVADPCKSLAYAFANKDVTDAFGIYLDHMLIGYVSIIFDEEDKMFNVWHFFIDQQFQGQGLGEKALVSVINKIKRMSKGVTNKVALTVGPDNTVAIKLYTLFGFEDTGQKDEDGEIIMIYDFTINQ